MKITLTQVFGFATAIRAARNPMNSWEKSDSYIGYLGDKELYEDSRNLTIEQFVLGIEDEKLSRQLTKAGGEHCKHLRHIQVWANIEVPRYIWQEADTYKFLEKISTSTMHKLLQKCTNITLDDFDYDIQDVDVMTVVLRRLNLIRKEWSMTKSEKEKTALLIRAKKLLPESFLQMRSINTNYQVLLNILGQREYHRLPEWEEICEWILQLPYFKELTGVEL